MSFGRRCLPWGTGAALLAAVVGLLISLRPAPPDVWKTRPLRLGYADEAPYAYADADGRVTGAWPEVARCVLTRLGAPEPEWVRTEFSELLPELKAGRIDIVVMGMLITPERAKTAAFSRPSAWVGTGFLVKAGNPKGLVAYGDFVREKAARLAVLDGAFEQDEARHAGVPDDQILLVPDVHTGAAFVKHGKADALALTGVTVRHLAASDPGRGLEAVALGDHPGKGAPALRRPCGYAFRLEDRELRLAFDRELGRLMATPAYAKLLAPFGFLDRNLSIEAPSAAGQAGGEPQ